MKGVGFIGIIAAATATWCGAQDNVPMQIRSARSRYDAAVKAAVDPNRLRYLEELDRMRASAMSQKNLDLANAIDAEIMKVQAEGGRSPEALSSALAGSTWSWGFTAATATSTLRFLPDGTYTVNNEPMGKWSVVDSSTIKFENGSRLKFSRDLTSYEATTPSGNRGGKKR